MGIRKLTYQGYVGKFVQSMWSRYALAAAVTFLAAIVRWALPGVLSDTPYLAFYPAVVTAAAFGGFGPGLTATIASFLTVDLVFDSTPGWIHLNDPVVVGRLIVFLAGGCGVSLIAELQRRGQSRERRQAEQLRESESFYRQTLESIPGMVFTTRPDGYCDYQSRQWVEFTGVPMEEHLGDGWNKLLHPDDRPRAYAAWRAAVEGRAAYELEYRVRRHDGEYRWFRVIGRPIRNAEGQIVRWFGVCIDIEDLKRAQDALRQARDELELRVRERTVELERAVTDLKRSNEDLQQFAYVSSHDLQEPLRMVASYVQLLEKRYGDKLDDDAKQFIAFAVDGSKRMSVLIKDLLEYSRVQSRGKPFAPVDCEQLFNVVLDNLKVRIQETGAEISHDPLPTVMADESQLTQVFQNLIDNAVKFRRPDIPPRVHISAEQRAQDVRFSIADNGIGIDARYHDRIFMIFQRLHTRHKYPGSGIGLSIVKRIVERHGGEVWVESNAWGGSTFHFTLALVSERPADNTP